MVSKSMPIHRPAIFSMDNTSQGPKTIPRNEAAPILKVLGFFSTQPAIILDAGRQKASRTEITMDRAETQPGDRPVQAPLLRFLDPLGPFFNSSARSPSEP
jgi:hypothetical protein